MLWIQAEVIRKEVKEEDNKEGWVPVVRLVLGQATVLPDCVAEIIVDPTESMGVENPVPRRAGSAAEIWAFRSSRYPPEKLVFASTTRMVSLL